VCKCVYVCVCIVLVSRRQRRRRRRHCCARGGGLIVGQKRRTRTYRTAAAGRPSSIRGAAIVRGRARKRAHTHVESPYPSRELPVVVVIVPIVREGFSSHYFRPRDYENSRLPARKSTRYPVEGKITPGTISRYPHDSSPTAAGSGERTPGESSRPPTVFA